MNLGLVEKSLLGTMLKENFLVLDSGLKAHYFASQIHKSLFICMEKLAQENKVVDFISITAAVDFVEANYLVDLNRFANPNTFDQNKEILIEKWREREKAVLLTQAQEENWSLDDIQQGVELLQNNQSDDVQDHVLNYLVSQYEKPFQELETKMGVPTGLQEIDINLNGFQDKELIILAARPSMGKTDTLNHFALQAGWAGYLPIVFSLEMGLQQMCDRLIATTGAFSRLKLRNPNRYLDEKQKGRWMKTLERVHRAGIYIDDRGGLTVTKIKAKARSVMKANPEKHPVIFIDYLQIIRPEGEAFSQNHAIGKISADLKQMAKDFACPVVVLSQLSRNVEQRHDKRPVMSDLRDSGNIEQDADVIAFLYREDYYGTESNIKNIMEINIAKNRNGPTGTVCVKYLKEIGTLMNIQNN